MLFFKANNKAKAKIENRYKAITIVILLLVIAAISERIYHDFFGQRNADHSYIGLLLVLFLSINLLYYIFIIQSKKFNRIIQSIEIGDDTFKVITFSFNIKYFPFELKAIEFEMKKGNVICKELKLDLRSIIDNLPFANSFALKYNNKDYYLVPSLFDEKEKVIEAVTSGIKYEV